MWKTRTRKGCRVTKKDAGQKNCKVLKVQKRKTEPKKQETRTKIPYKKIGIKVRNTHQEPPWKKDKCAG